MLKRIAYIIVVLLVMWTGVSVAMADTIPPSPVTSTDWRGILSVIGVSLGGLGIFLSGVAKVLHAFAPLTKTTLDDRAAEKLDQVAEVVYAVRDHVLGLVKMASGPQQVQPDPAPAPPLAVVPPPRNPQAGRVRLTVVVLLALGAGVTLPAISALDGCATLKSDGKAVGSAIVDCTGGGVFGIAQTVLDTVRAWDQPKDKGGCMDGGKLDWSCVYDRAIAKGKEIGGCALVEQVSSSPPRSASLAPDQGRATLERFRAAVGGVQWRTAAGVQ